MSESVDLSQCVPLSGMEEGEEFQVSAGCREDEKHREEIEKVLAFNERAFDVMLAYMQNQLETCEAAPRLALELFMTAKTMAHALYGKRCSGENGAAEIGRKLFPSNPTSAKAAANKCMNTLMTRLNLPPLPQQRDKEARDNMRAARKEQLEHTRN